MTQPVKRPNLGEKALVALGSNAKSRHGSPRGTLERALAALDEGPVRVAKASRFFLTPFVPAGEAPDVVNAVALVVTELEPVELLAHLHRIETDFDRARGARWTSRSLDLDLLAMGERILPDRAGLETWMTMPFREQKHRTPETLILPHPRLQDRAFVIVPAAEVAPDWRHPLSGQTIAQMCAQLPDEELEAVRPLDP